MDLVNLNLDKTLYRATQPSPDAGGFADSSTSLSDNTASLDSANPLSNSVISDSGVSGSSNSSGSNNSAGSNGQTDPINILSGEVTGNLVMLDGFIRSKGFATGSAGWTINADGTAEFLNASIRGTLRVGGATNYVIADATGLRGYSATLGNTFNLPTDGSAPTFSSGIINSTVFNVGVGAVIETAVTVGDGSASSAGILMNNTGFYACQANQLLANANVKILIDGTASFSGAISSSTINIPNATTPLFSVDSAGNATVNSLARNDYHIFTMFESVNGYAVTSSGLGSVSVSETGILLVTGHYNTNKETARKRLASSMGLSFDNKTNIKLSLNSIGSTNQHAWIVYGDISTNVKRHIGWYKHDGTLYGTCGNNTSESTVSLGYITGGLLELRYVPGASIKYYLDGTYIDQITTNLPSGEVSADIFINLSIENTDATNVDIPSMQISWYDLWQSN